MSFLNLHEVETLARATLPAATFEYFAGGACDEVTLSANRRAFDELACQRAAALFGAVPHVFAVDGSRE